MCAYPTYIFQTCYRSPLIFYLALWIYLQVFSLDFCKLKKKLHVHDNEIVMLCHK